MCVYQEHNGDEKFSPVRALGRRCVSIRRKVRNRKNAENMSAALKFATTALNYPSLKGIPIDRVDTHSLISVGANALLLVGYSDIDIQNGKMERGNV